MEGSGRPLRVIRPDLPADAYHRPRVQLPLPPRERFTGREHRGWQALTGPPVWVRPVHLDREAWSLRPPASGDRTRTGFDPGRNTTGSATELVPGLCHPIPACVLIGPWPFLMGRPDALVRPLAAQYCWQQMTQIPLSPSQGPARQEQGVATHTIWLDALVPDFSVAIMSTYQHWKLKASA